MDEDIRSLRRALERAGQFRFVALLSAERYREKEPAPGWVRVTAARRCGADGYRNLSRAHYWALPVLTLEDLADVQRSFAVEWLYDLELRLEMMVCQRSQQAKDFHEGDWPSFELEEGWGDTTFAKDCSVADLRRRFGSPWQVACKLASDAPEEGCRDVQPSKRPVEQVDLVELDPAEPTARPP